MRNNGKGSMWFNPKFWIVLAIASCIILWLLRH